MAEQTRNSYEDAELTATYILSRTEHRPKIGIILGSGLGGLADDIKNPTILDYSTIPNFLVSTAPSHRGRLVIGMLEGQCVVCMQGRFHVYEGYDITQIIFPVRVMRMLGVRTMMVTSAVGAINPNYCPGDFMIVKDQINFAGLTGTNPLVGSNDDRFGPRFVAMSNAYDKPLRVLAKNVARDLQVEHVTREGIILSQSGPCYESIAEVRMMATLGADVVGMSMVHEVIAARHCGLKVFAMCLVTNMVVLDYETKMFVNEAEVLEMGRERSNDFRRFMKRMLKLMS